MRQISPLGTVNPMPATGAPADASAGMCGGGEKWARTRGAESAQSRACECALAASKVRTRRSEYPHTPSDDA